jgi:hypothetical protein
MKHGSGIKGRDDRSRGIEIRISEALVKINPTDPLILAKQPPGRNLNCSDSSDSSLTVYIRNFVAQNCLKIVRDIEKLEPLTDGFTHFQLILKTMNTRIQYTSANITLPLQEHFVSAQNRHVDTFIQNAILKKGTRR